MLDIRNGDLLVVKGETYPIKSAGWWESGLLSAAAFRRMTSVTASTMRSPEPVAGRRGAAVLHLSGLQCTPLDPVDAETRRRLVIESPHTLLQTYTASGEGFLHLIVEDLR